MYLIVAAGRKTQTHKQCYSNMCKYIGEKMYSTKTNKLKITTQHQLTENSSNFVKLRMQIEKKEKVFMIKIMLHFFVFEGESVTLKLIEVLKGKFQEDFLVKILYFMSRKKIRLWLYKEIFKA